jgi:diguanylate cyclase (GGDEF)-like protein
MFQQLRPEFSLGARFRELVFPEAQYLKRKMEDHRNLFATLQMTTVIAGCLMWFWDYAMDPVHAPSTLLLRLSHVVLLINVYNALARTERRVHVLCTMLTGLWLVALYVLVLNRLDQGYAYGVGGFMYFMIMVLVLFQGFSWVFLVALSVMSAALPQVIAVLGFAPGFPHFQYSVLIWPACGLVNICLFTFELNYLHRYRSEQMLEYESNHDALTGAWNRRYFMPYVEGEITAGRRLGNTPALLIIDIDHFKQVNDRYGHPMGDKVICTLTEVATQILNRNSDVLARLGGEEFAILLPATPLDGAVAVAQRLCSTFEATPMVCDSGETFHCTISIGIAKGVLGGSIAEREADLISRADVALYQAKNTGRNKVCVSAEEPKLKALT